MTKDEKIKLNYFKILAWLIAERVCGQCLCEDESRCDVCRKEMAAAATKIGG